MHISLAVLQDRALSAAEAKTGESGYPINPLVSNLACRRATLFSHFSAPPPAQKQAKAGRNSSNLATRWGKGKGKGKKEVH